MNRTIALLTDFGLSDNYVGIMKAVIRKIAPNTDFIDITHDIEPQNIKHGAFILSNSYQYFPDGTIFLAVVDPGVGSERKAICVKTKSYIFLAPNNGILTYVLEKETISDIIEITNEKYHLSNKSNTFHGRDIFAPVAGHICNGIELTEFGEKLLNEKIIKIPDLICNVEDNQITGEIIYADRFGNLVSSLHHSKFNLSDIKSVQVKEIQINGISKTFSDVKEGNFVAYIGSSGYLEIGIRNGNAKSVIKDTERIHLKC